MMLNDTIALVTGAGRGLGAATARHFAQNGASVAVIDLDGAAAQTVAEQIGGIAVSCDVSDVSAVEAGFRSVERAFGAAPRVVVNCAGIAPAARIVARDGTTSLDVFQRTLQVNLMGTYTVMTRAAQGMLALDPTITMERGVIINTASIAWEDGQIGQAAYAASKGAVAAMSLPAAREFSRSGIRVVAIAPGLFQTPMMESLPTDVTDTIVANIPFPSRLGAPEEYALMAAQIVENPYLNGTTIRLDGATRLPPR